mgnify:FL=1
MAYGWYDQIVFSNFARAFLDGSPFLNRDDFEGYSGANNSVPEIKITSPYSYSTGSNTHQVDFTVTDADGINMVAFFGKIDVADASYTYFLRNSEWILESFSRPEDTNLTSITGSNDFGTHFSDRKSVV